MGLAEILTVQSWYVSLLKIATFEIIYSLLHEFTAVHPQPIGLEVLSDPDPRPPPPTGPLPLFLLARSPIVTTILPVRYGSMSPIQMGVTA